MPSPQTIANRIGSRGAMLLVLSALWVRLFLWPLVEGRAADAGLFYYTWPIELRVALWAATILVAVIAAFFPPRKDWFGWAALVLMPMQRLSAWAWAGISGTIPAGRAIEQVALYGLLVAAVLIAAAMRPPHIDEDHQAHTPRHAAG